MAAALPVQHHRLLSTAGVDDVIAALHDRAELAVLDSSDLGPGRGRYTIVAVDPIETFVHQGGDSDPFKLMRNNLERTQLAEPSACEFSKRCPFVGGWIGYFAYEAGRHIETLPSRAANDVDLPMARFGLYDTAAVYDGQEQAWSIVAVTLPDSRQDAASRLARWERFFEEINSASLPQPPRNLPVSDNMTKSQYLGKVAQAREYIAAGDIFQVNFARRQSFRIDESPADIYRRLRACNPSAYGALLQWRGRDDSVFDGVASASPELFLTLSDDKVVTRPIKGTINRSDDPIVDDANRAALARSEKDRAELAMIVDLLRNDLGRVCRFGSVKVVTTSDSVAKPYRLESHPTVHHLVAEVVGQLRVECDAIDLLRASFPGGSITGAPKVRAMEIIDELEPTVRSVYTGSVGYFSCNGRMEFNIAIRTICFAGGDAHVYAGGGIVADSIPENEYLETQWKVLGLCRALGVTKQPAAAMKPTS